MTAYFRFLPGTSLSHQESKKCLFSVLSLMAEDQKYRRQLVVVHGSMIYSNDVGIKNRHRGQLRAKSWKSWLCASLVVVSYSLNSYYVEKRPSIRLVVVFFLIYIWNRISQEISFLNPDVTFFVFRIAPLYNPPCASGICTSGISTREVVDPIFMALGLRLENRGYHTDNARTIYLAFYFINVNVNFEFKWISWHPKIK